MSIKNIRREIKKRLEKSNVYVYNYNVKIYSIPKGTKNYV